MSPADRPRNTFGKLAQLRLFCYNPTMRRHIIGTLALLLLALGIGQLVWLGSDSANLAFLGNSGIRIGLVLGALWLAFPEVKRLAAFINSMPSWLFYTSIGSLFAAGLIRSPWALLLIVPALFLMWLLKPPPQAKRVAKNKERQETQSGADSK